MSVLYLLIVIYYIIAYYYYYSPWNYNFNRRTGVLVIDLAVKCTIQPPLLPGCLKEGRYSRVVMGAMDGEWRGDHNALGLRFIRWLEGKIYTINYFCYSCKGGALWDIMWQYTTDSSVLCFIWIGFIIIQVILNSTISQGTIVVHNVWECTWFEHISGEGLITVVSVLPCSYYWIVRASKCHDQCSLHTINKLNRQHIHIHCSVLFNSKSCARSYN